MTTYSSFPTDSILAAARFYRDRGLRPVPVPYRQKGPVVEDWPNVRFGDDLPKWFPDNRTSNMGLDLDPVAALADVDLDSAEAVRAGRRWLPRTDWLSGRTTKPESHHWYRPDGPVRYLEFNDVDGARILELRAGHGLQTVCPPGFHVDGDEIVWHRFDGGPTPIPAADLTRLVGEVAALAILVKHWPAKGGRDDACLGLIGGLLRAGWPVARVEEFVAAVADLTDDEDARKRVAKVVRSEERLKNGDPTRGWPFLAKVLTGDGAEVVKRVRDWLKVPEPAAEPWPDLIPLLAPAPALPLFPVDILPPWVGDWATAAAVALQVPVDLPATLALAACSAGVAQKVVAVPRPGWAEPVNTYWVTALPPSDRKTQAFTRAVAPVFEMQDRIRQESAPARREAEATQKALLKRAARLEDKYAKAETPEERTEALEELKAVKAEFDQLIVPVLPQLLVDDETPDNLTKTVCEQGGRLFQASAEGTLFENIGRWSDKPTFDIYLKAYSGDPLSVGRVTRARTECRHPALTCAIAPQPAVIEGLGEDPSLAGRGFLARWFYALPQSKVGARVIGPPHVPDAVRQRYHAGVEALWGMAGGADEDGRPQPWRLAFTPEADRVIRAFERWVEPRLAEGGDLWALAGWGGKAAGGAVRIAAVLHLAEAGVADGPRLPPVSVSAAERAVRLVRDYLVPHARAAFGLIGSDPTVTRARKVVRWFTTEGRTTFTVRDANQAMKGTIRTVDDLIPVLDLIERHHYIRQADLPRRPGRGRPRSPAYEVHPDVHATREGASDGATSENNENCEPGDGAGPPDEPDHGDAGPSGPPTDGPETGSGVPNNTQKSDPGPGPRDSGNIEICEPDPPSPEPDSDPMVGGDGSVGTGSAPRAHKSQYPQKTDHARPGAINGDIEICETGGSSPHTGTALQGPGYAGTGGPGPGQNSLYSQKPATAGDAGPADLSVEESDRYHPGVTPVPHFMLVRNPAELAAVVSAVEESTVVGVDLETTGLDPRKDKVRLIAVDCDTNAGSRFTYLVDAFTVEVGPLLATLADAELVIHNAAFDLGFLAKLDFVPGKVHDTLLLSQVLYASARTKGVAPVRHGLKDCCERELGVALAKDLQASDWSGPLTHDQLAYAATDAAVLVPLYRKLTEKLDGAGLGRAAAIEAGALPAIAWMAGAGVPFDRAAWQGLADEAATDASRIAAELDAAAPPKADGLFDGRWNWDSPDQVKEALAAAGCALKSTRDDELAALDQPLAALVRDYRDARKRETTYGGDWLKHVAEDDRVYPRWVQLGANSGRMACAGPNMQNLPRGAYRRCIAAPPGKVLVKADYSQIELRIAAKVSGDKALLAAYDRGDDLHTLTARNVLGIAEVTKEHRQLAKAINFGLLYGMGAKAFRAYAKTNYGVELTDDRSAGYREAFFKAYPGLRRWHRSVGDRAQDTRTLAGRRVLNVERFTEKLNLPVQGTGADGLKLALGLLWERRHECPTPVPVLAVHDEIVVECPAGDADAVKAWLRTAMVDAMAPLVAPVPVEVEVKVGPTWGGE
jgi:DNA polymerase I-like protein with 3'-5' exonuclease and polymerase domains